MQIPLTLKCSISGLFKYSTCSHVDSIGFETDPNLMKLYLPHQNGVLKLRNVLIAVKNIVRFVDLLIFNLTLYQNVSISDVTSVIESISVSLI